MKSIEQIIQEYLYTRDDLLDLNDVPELSSGIAEQLNDYGYEDKSKQ